MKLGKLTNGEMLFVERRRSNVSQGQAAKRWSISRQIYSDWELDKELKKAVKMSMKQIGHLNPYEKCVLLRRRKNIEQWQIAEALGVSRYWVNQMELGKVSCEALIGFWSNVNE